MVIEDLYTIRDYLLNEKIIKYKKTNKGKVLLWIDCNCKLSSDIERVIELYSDRRTFLYCLSYNILPSDIPLCPICGSKCKLSSSGKRFFRKTCLKQSCQNKMREIKSLNRYGCKNVSQAKEVQEKKEKLSLEKFGTTTPLKNEEVKIKIKKSLEGHYGKNYAKVINNERVKTFKEKYGVENPSQVKEFQNKKSARYKYDGYNFRSSYELIFYLYCKELNLKVVYESISIPYKDNEGNIHYYYPDFIVDDQLIEIKGDHLLDEEGNLNSSLYNDSDKQKEIDKCKQKCMEENKVIILKKEDIDIIREKISDRYSENFLKSLKS